MPDQITFNLLHAPWIPILRHNGKAEKVGILTALTQAAQIRQIAASNPMDRVALLRFLLSVLMWCRENAKSSLAALDPETTGIPADWLQRLMQHEAAFNLLGDGKRFYQEASLKGSNTRPIADLLVEFPGADSVNHMRHVLHDGSYGFCPACCTMGILRLSVWAPANHAYPASVNPASAAYVLREEKNLFQTLRANLPDANPHSDLAPWLADAPPESPDSVARLTWRPRKLWLNDTQGGSRCAYCGAPGAVVTSLCIERGWPTPVTSGQQFGRDVLEEFQKLHAEYRSKNTDRRKLADKVVAVAPVIRKCRMDDLRKACNQDHPTLQSALPITESDQQEIAWRFHQLISRNDECARDAIKALTARPSKDEQEALGDDGLRAKKFWDADPHLLADGEPISSPSLSADPAVHASSFWRSALRLQRSEIAGVTAIGPAVNKFTFQDATAVALPDATPTVKERANLSAECRAGLGGLLRDVTPNPDRQHPEIDSALKLLTPDVEAQIRDRLYRRNPSTPDDAAEHTEFLQALFEPVVESVVASATPGSPRRRFAARKDAHALLNKKIRELAQKSGNPSNTDLPPPNPGGLSRKTRKGGTK